MTTETVAVVTVAEEREVVVARGQATAAAEAAAEATAADVGTAAAMVLAMVLADVGTAVAAMVAVVRAAAARKMAGEEVATAGMATAVADSASTPCTHWHTCPVPGPVPGTGPVPDPPFSLHMCHSHYTCVTHLCTMLHICVNTQPYVMITHVCHYSTTKTHYTYVMLDFVTNMCTHHVQTL